MGQQWRQRSRCQNRTASKILKLKHFQAATPEIYYRDQGDFLHQLHTNQFLVSAEVSDVSDYYGLSVRHTSTAAADPLCIYKVECEAARDDLLVEESTGDGSEKYQNLCFAYLHCPFLSDKAFNTLPFIYFIQFYTPCYRGLCCQLLLQVWACQRLCHALRPYGSGLLGILWG